MSANCLVVIPSRYGSTRFPGKVLAELGGRPIVQWCYEAAKAARVGPVIVATEDERVADVVRSFGGDVQLTSERCQSGSDRVFEAARGWRGRFVINLQGDAPLMRPGTILRVARILAENPNADIATAVMPLEDSKRAADPNVVKAAMGESGRCLYFSRSPIPFPRNKPVLPMYEHLGIYGYRAAALKRFVRLPPSSLEKTESLEQLRALEAGMTIFAAVVSDVPVAIDTPADLKRAHGLLPRLWQGRQTDRRRMK